ncbi:MAG: molybdopterin-dependent oxidoreductase [Gemmatimonadaceae bacterium]|nr:molybdopterin-dependent oxidoreductase [Gemmatimonadaceae bacterium]
MRTLIAMLFPLVLMAQAGPSVGLSIRLPGAETVVFDSARLSTLPRTEGRVTLHGAALRYEGVDLRVLLQAAGLARVDSLRGDGLRRVVVFTGADGYSAVIALADLDASIGARRAVVVDRENGAPLGGALGPLRIIVPDDRRASRSVRNLIRVDVIEVP